MRKQDRSRQRGRQNCNTRVDSCRVCVKVWVCPEVEKASMQKSSRQLRAVFKQESSTSPGASASQVFVEPRDQMNRFGCYPSQQMDFDFIKIV